MTDKVIFHVSGGFLYLSLHLPVHPVTDPFKYSEYILWGPPSRDVACRLGAGVPGFSLWLVGGCRLPASSHHFLFCVCLCLKFPLYIQTPAILDYGHHIDLILTWLSNAPMLRIRSYFELLGVRTSIQIWGWGGCDTIQPTAGSPFIQSFVCPFACSFTLPTLLRYVACARHWGGY